MDGVVTRWSAIAIAVEAVIGGVYAVLGASLRFGLRGGWLVTILPIRGRTYVGTRVPATALPGRVASRLLLCGAGGRPGNCFALAGPGGVHRAWRVVRLRLFCCAQR